jgi:geranylgeranyl reductase family protein
LEDIVVIGGGPIGCYSALNALDHETDVKIFEEHGEPGIPEHCTGHISVKGLEDLDLKIPNKIVQQHVSGYRFYSPSGSSLTFKFKKPQTLIINRKEFDKWLVDKFLQKGGKYNSDTMVKRITPKLGNWKIEYAHKRSIKKTESNILINSEGFPPSLLMHIGYFSLYKSHNIFGIQTWMNNVKGVDQGVVDIYLTGKYSPGFYGWIAPLSNGTAKVGLGSISPNVRLLLDMFKTKHPVASYKLENAKIQKIRTHIIPLNGPLRKVSWKGLMAVGDAASQVKQTTGGGLITGLSCARIAGKTASLAAKNKDPKEVTRYESIFWKRHSLNFRFMKILRNTLNRFSDQKLDKLIEDLSRQTDEISLEEDIDFDNQLSSIYNSLRNPVLARRFMRIAFNIITVR